MANVEGGTSTVDRRGGGMKLVRGCHGSGGRGRWTVTERWRRGGDRRGDDRWEVTACW